MRSSYQPPDAVELFGDLPGWWIAGGWAIDLWLGQQTREHVDLDIVTLRTNQRVFWRRLQGWTSTLGSLPTSSSRGLDRASSLLLSTPCGVERHPPAPG